MLKIARVLNQGRIRILNGIVVPVVLLLLFTGCVSSKKLVLFQEEENGQNSSQGIAEEFVPTIQSGDVLFIQISSLNPEASAIFNTADIAAASQAMALSNSANPLAYQPGYLVGKDGMIELPMLGKIKVVDLTTSEIANIIREKTRLYLKEPTVSVRNVNFRISVLGEVSRPGMFLINNERINILQALSMANDITIAGKRDNILIIREEGGKKTFNRIDLTKRNFFNSPYYYLHPNDIIYIEPTRARINSADQTFQILPLAFSGVSVALVVVSLLIR